MLEAPRERPEDLRDVIHPLLTSPDGRLGYIKIHKCGSNTYYLHLMRKERWLRSFRKDSGFSTRSGFRADPNPERIIVIVRDPIERWISGLVQVGGSQVNAEILYLAKDSPEVYTHRRNQHLWPYTWFLWEWEPLFGDRFEVVLLSDAADWFLENNVPLPPPEDRHRNAGPRDAVELYRRELLTPERVKQLRAYYKHDYDLLRDHGITTG